MKVDTGTKRVEFFGEDGNRFEVYHSNQGEPYREGISMHLGGGEYETFGRVFLEDFEAMRLRDLLNKLYPPEK